MAGLMLDDVRVEVTPETAREYREQTARLHRVAARAMRRYYDDPVAFAHDCIAWPEGQGLTGYQDEVLAAIPTQHRVAQRGPRGLGKSTTNAMAVLWFALTRDAAGVDWKCATTAGGWHQLEQYLWPEIHKWAAKLRWDKLGRDAFQRGELQMLNLKLNHGSAFAVASNVPARIEGAHADSLMFIYDESKIISNETFDASEGSLAGMGEAFAFASSTPGEPVGRFYDIHTHKPGLEDWTTFHITLEQAITAGRIDAVWAHQRKLLWGENSALYANQVLGEFHSDDESSVIPLAWIEAAVQRHRDRTFAYCQEHHVEQMDLGGKFDRVGVDVAESGGDKTVQSVWMGHRCHELRVTSGEDTVQTASRVEGLLNANPEATAVIDADGLGVGVYNDLNHAGCKVEAFHASAATDKKDESGELGFINVRAAAWWHLREQLDPRNDPDMELPDDPLLIGDLTAPKWEQVGRSNIKVEAKKEIRKRLGRSPDAGDACMMAVWRDRKRKRRRMVAAGRA